MIFLFVKNCIHCIYSVEKYIRIVLSDIFGFLELFWRGISILRKTDISLIYRLSDHVEEENQVKPETGCSKLTTLIVKVLLKFQMLISKVRQYFLLKKYEKLFPLIFSTKNISVLHVIIKS